MTISIKDYSLLGDTDICVSRLCFGTLTVSPLQHGYTTYEASKLFCYAIDKGINFFDTAKIYDNYNHIRETIKYKKDIIVATKDYCYDEITAKNAVNTALNKIGRDYIDIFLLHEQESMHTIRGHWEAIEHLLKRVEKGDIRAIGLSTHYIDAVKAATEVDEVKIIHPIYNYSSLGIADGSHNEMADAISKCIEKNKGVYLMKALGGGHLIDYASKAINFVKKIDRVSSIAIGMKSEDEIDFNIALLNGEKADNNVYEIISKKKRQLLIHNWCVGCGECIKVCNHNALKVVNGKMTVDQRKCVFCGYCAARCKEFCIKVI